MYGVFRFINFMSILFFPSLSTVTGALPIIIYVSLMAIGQHYGQQLLQKMKTMKDQTMKRQLTKLTMFIIVENSVLIMLLVVYVIRTLGFTSKKNTIPW